MQSITDVLDKAIAAGASADTIRALIEAAERQHALEAKKAFEAAVRSARNDLGPVIKSRTGGNKAKYADFLDVTEHVDPVLDRHGLSYRYSGDVSPTGAPIIICILTHEAGHSERTPLPIPADAGPGRSVAQAVGSSSTYGQRYTLMLALGLATARDDDGRASRLSAGATITDREAKLILDGLDATGSSLERFLKVYGIEALEEMPAAKFADAMAKIDAKRSRANA